MRRWFLQNGRYDARHLIALLTALLLCFAGCFGDSGDGGVGRPALIPVDSETAAYLESVAARVAGEGNDVALELYDVDAVFALALGDNRIAISRGMLYFLASEAQYACLIGHELAHHHLDHVAADASGDLMDTATRRRLSAHEGVLTNELAADKHGMDLCTAAGYDAIALPDLLLYLESSARAIADGDGRIASMHWDIRTRIEAALAHYKATETNGDRLGSRDYRMQIEKLAAEDSAGTLQRDGNPQVQHAFLPDHLIPPGLSGNAMNCYGVIGDVINDTGVDAAMNRETHEWMEGQCQANANPDGSLPPLRSNDYDAFGHCWIGCRVTQVAGPGCAFQLGAGREITREAEDVLARWGIDIFGIGPHDSFWQDTTNQEVGRELAAENDGASCSSLCGGAFDNNQLDLSAPTRTLSDCETLEPMDNFLGMEAQCGNAAFTEYFFKNPYSESSDARLRDTDVLVSFEAGPNSDKLNVEPVKDHRLGPSDAVDVDVSRDCECSCGEGSSSADEMIVTIEPRNPRFPNAETFTRTVNVATGCRRIPEDCGSSANEPHMRTFDGLRYDFQAVGEFVLVKSDDGALEVQVRQKNVTKSAAANSAIAMRAGGTRISYYAQLNDGFEGLYIDGERVDGPVSRTLADGKSTITSTNFGYEVRLENGSRVSVAARFIVNVVVAARNMRVTGLLGDADGDVRNDLSVPGGQAFKGTDFAQLYGAFADRWRVTPETSLFDYPAGASTEAYTRKEYPTEYVTLATLSEQDKKSAAAVCREAAVPASWFDDCVFDVTVTGDPRYASNFGLDFAVGPDLVFADRPLAGTALPVHWRGPDRADDVIAIAERGAEAKDRIKWRYTSDGSPLAVGVPEQPGDYEVRYLQARSGAILASAPLTVIEANVRVEAPASVVAGADFDVSWDGPGDLHDQLTIAGIDALPRHKIAWRYVAGESPTSLRAPDSPGRYEVRYLHGVSGLPLATTALEVIPALASIKVPESVAAGSHFDVIWDGPDNTHDQLAVAAVDSAPREKLHWQYVSKGSPVAMRAPDVAGTYELRYLSGQTGAVMTRQTIEVGEVTARLEAPTVIAAGSQFDVIWEGPDNVHDQLSVADTGASPRSKRHWQYVSGGSPTTLRAPDEPGRYEVRYLNGQSGSVLSTRSIEVSPVSARLDVPATVSADETFAVVWEGPSNVHDRIAIVATGEGSAKQLLWKYTTAGSPIEFKAPGEPGRYEVHYINGQSHGVLERVSFQVD